MTVYLEYAFAENFFIDFILLFLSAKTVRGKIRLLPLFLSSLAGTVFALFFPLLPLPPFLYGGIKLLFGAVLCAVAHVRGTLKTTLAMTGFFYLYTFTLGGLLTAAYTLLGWQYTEEGVFVLSAAPLPLALFGTLFFALLASILLPKIVKKIKFFSRSAKCEISLRENRVEVYALLDSGNVLTVDGEPVSVVSLAVAARLVCDLSHTTKTKKVEVATVNGTGSISVFQIDELKIYFNGQPHTIIGAYLGISRHLDDSCPMILNSAYIPTGGNL